MDFLLQPVNIGRVLLADEGMETVFSTDVSMYFWMTIVAALVAFIMAFGIGANDVANTFGTSVGAKSIKLWQACVIAGIMEFGGCVLMGKNVTDTVRKGIIDPEAFAEAPQVLMLGMLCALVGAGAWLLIATHLSMPVSTTHSIIGGILGFGMCYGNAAQTVNWSKIALVVLSWIASPVLSGIVAAILFWFTRWLVLRRENSLRASYIFYPFFLFVMFLTMALFIIIKGSPRYGLKKLDLGYAILISIGVAVALTILAYFLVFKLIVQPRIEKCTESLLEAKFKVQYKAGSGHTLDLEAEADGADDTPAVPAKDIELVCTKQERDIEEVGMEMSDEALIEEDEQKRRCIGRVWHTYLNPQAMEDKVHKEIGDKAAETNYNAEKFDPKTELVFSGVQVVTAAFGSFAHGANDTANAIGPLAAIIGVFSCGCIGDKMETPFWVMILGGGGIVIGLIVLGWRVIRTVGVKLVRVTPSRGYTMELASALATIVASKAGIPVSTTHCQVGAEIGVGLLEGGPCGSGNGAKFGDGVNWKLFGKIFLGWIFTLVFAAGTTAALFSFCLYSPFNPTDASVLNFTTTMVPAS